MKSLLHACVLTLALSSIAASSFAATFVYVHSRSTSEIFGFELNKDGTLTALAGSPFATGTGNGSCGGYCQTMAYAKKGKALVAGGFGGISSMVVAKDGSLSHAPGSPVALTGDFLGTGVIKNGNYVYVNDYDGDSVYGFEVGKDGSLSAISGSPWPTGGSGPDGLSASKKSVVVANENDESVASFQVGKDGALTAAPGSPVAPGFNFIYNVDIEPKGKFLYVGDCGVSEIRAFSIDKKTAALMEIGGSPFPAAFTVCGGTAPTKKGLIAFELVDELQAFARDKKTGALSLPQTPASTTSADSHALSKNERILVLADDGADTVDTFAVDPKTGTITPIDSASIAGAEGANATAIVKR